MNSTQEKLHFNLIYAIQQAQRDKISNYIIMSKLWSALFAFSSTIISVDIEKKRIGI